MNIVGIGHSRKSFNATTSVRFDWKIPELAFVLQLRIGSNGPSNTVALQQDCLNRLTHSDSSHNSDPVSSGARQCGDLHYLVWFGISMPKRLDE